MKKIILLLFIVPSLFAQNSDFNNYDREIISNIYNGNWAAADSLIDAKLQTTNTQPKYFFLKAYNYTYARFWSSDYPLNRDTTIQLTKYYTWEAVKRGENIENDIHAKFYTGCAYAFLARADIMSGEYWDAYWNASKSQDLLEEVIEENPNYNDAYLNLGVVEYWADVGITGWTAFFAWLGGMSGDRELGWKYFNTVAEDGYLFRDEAKFIIAIAARAQENDPQLALSMYEELSSRYPNNIRFTSQRDQARLLAQVEENGVDILESEIDTLVEKYNINNANILNILGYTLVNQNRLDEATTVFRVNIKLFPDVANCYDSMGECYLTRGDNENAIKYYKIAFDKLDSDSTITDDFRERLRQGIQERLADLNASPNV